MSFSEKLGRVEYYLYSEGGAMYANAIYFQARKPFFILQSKCKLYFANSTTAAVSLGLVRKEDFSFKLVLKVKRQGG